MSIETASAFDQLQSALVRGTDFNQELLLDALMADPGSVESYSTFYRALVKAKIDPTELLTTAASLSIQIDNHYLMYVGLALRFGANPNTYVNGTFDIDGVATEIPVQLAKNLWDMTPRSIEESSRPDRSDVFLGVNHPLLDILAMLSLSGLDANLPVSDPELLLAAGIDATAFVAERPDFGYSVYETLDNDGELGVIVANHLRTFASIRGNLQLAYANSSTQSVEPEKLLAYAFHLDLEEILTMGNLYAEVDNYRKLIFFQDVRAFTILADRLKQLGLIAGSTSNQSIDPIRNNNLKLDELLLQWSIEYYSLEVMILLLQTGVRVDDKVKNRTIERAKACCEPYPAQCQLLNRILVEYTRQGYRFNQQQLLDIKQYSPITYEAVNLPLAAVSNTIAAVEIPKPKQILKRLLITDRVLPSIGTGTIDDRSMNLQALSAPYCSNEGSLAKPIDKYNEVDRVVYSDGISTWCFTSDNYPELLRTGINPWAVSHDGGYNVPIPPEIMREIAEKYDAIKCNRLITEKPKGEGVIANRDVEELYRFAETYGIPRENFYRLTAREFQQNADVIVNPQHRAVIDQSSPILAIRDFARAVLNEARYNPNRIGQLLRKLIN